jgi:hypothetical protein
MMSNDPQVFKTLKEASMHQAKVRALDEMLAAMTPVDRQEWLQINCPDGDVDKLLENIE